MKELPKNPCQLFMLTNEELAIAQEVVNEVLEQNPGVLGNIGDPNPDPVPMDVDPAIDPANSDDDSVVNWNLLAICDQDEDFEISGGGGDPSVDDNASDATEPIHVQEQPHLFHFCRDEDVSRGKHHKPPSDSDDDYPRMPSRVLPSEESHVTITMTSEPLTGLPYEDDDPAEGTDGNKNADKSAAVYVAGADESGYIDDDDDANYPPMPVLEPQVPWPPVRKEPSPGYRVNKHARRRSYRRRAIGVLQSVSSRRRLRSSSRQRSTSSSSGVGRDEEDDTGSAIERSATPKGIKRPRSESPPGPHIRRSSTGLGRWSKNLDGLPSWRKWKRKQEKKRLEKMERSSRILRSSKTCILADCKD